jgi:hypothetical protein
MLTPATVCLAVISVSLGAILARRFNVLILIPVISLALLLGISIGILRGDTVGHVVLGTLVVVLGFQLGYSFKIWMAHRLFGSRTIRPPLTDGLGATPLHD